MTLEGVPGSFCVFGTIIKGDVRSYIEFLPLTKMLNQTSIAFAYPSLI